MRGRSRRGFAVTRHRDLIAVRNVRGEVHRDEIRIVRRAAGLRERIARTSVTGKRVHTGMQDRTRNVHERLNTFSNRRVHAFGRARDLRCGTRRELRRPSR